jgi:signal transduction histidine kinase
MKKLSIKKKLTLWYGLTIFLVSSILFISFYLITNRYLVYETDRSLSIHSSQVAYNVGINTNSLHDTQTKDILELSQKEAPGMFVQIVDSQGFNVDGTISDFSALAKKAVSTKNPQYTQVKVNEFSMRVIAYPITSNNSTLGAVIMGHQIDVYEKTLSQIRIIGILLLMFLISPSILIGYWLAKSATDPIKRLSLDINKINSENLSRHVELKVDTEESDLLVNNFNSLLDRLNNAFNLEKQFLGEMAHEVKTPLSVIKSNSEVTLSKIRSPEEYQQSIQQTLSQIDKLTKSLLSLMDFAWAQSSEAKIKFEKLNLSQLMLEIESVAKYTSAPKEITIISDIADAIYIQGKEEKLYQAIYNIVDNAVKFTPRGGLVEIKLYNKNEDAVIEVKDNGIGIDKEQQKSIFSRFYRTEQNKNIAGHGLGLAIADSIVKAHDGQIKLESEKDKGSTFKVVFKALRN